MGRGAVGLALATVAAALAGARSSAPGSFAADPIDLNGATRDSYVSSCAEAAGHAGSGGDGYYRLMLEVDAVDFSNPEDPAEWPLKRTTYRALVVYCHMMNREAPGAPVAYLDMDKATNYATWIYGDSTLTTRFSKVRFDERSQMIYSADCECCPSPARGRASSQSGGYHRRHRRVGSGTDSEMCAVVATVGV